MIETTNGEHLSGIIKTETPGVTLMRLLARPTP
jgi:hypothetical protein